MNLYMIRDTRTNLWYRHPALGGRPWVAQAHASQFHSKLDAEARIEHDDCVVVKFLLTESEEPSEWDSKHHGLTTAFSLKPSSPRAVFVEHPDLDALYVDGKFVCEGKGISVIGAKKLVANDRWLDARMASDPEVVYPKYLNDVVVAQ